MSTPNLRCVTHNDQREMKGIAMKIPAEKKTNDRSEDAPTVGDILRTSNGRDWLPLGTGSVRTVQKLTTVGAENGPAPARK